jgi:hypothetical protein
MRNLSVGDSPRHFCCVLQQACADRASCSRDRAQAGRERPRQPNGFHRAAPVHAVTLVARGNSRHVVSNH